MTLLTDLLGADLGEIHVTVEAGAVRLFAHAITDEDPSFAGAGATVPPTMPFVFPYWGDAGEGGAAGLPLDRLRGPDRMLLHGEQRFTYHRPVRAGDSLVGRQKVLDVYERESGRFDMHFYVTRTTWSDAGSDEAVCESEFTLIVRVPKDDTTAD